MKTKIGIGTVQFGTNYGISNNTGQTTPGEINKILSFSLENGINTIDTASAYGEAEDILGTFDLSGFDLVSKFILDDKNDVNECLYSSLEKLNTKSIYAYMAHRPMQLITINDSWQKLNDLKQEGKIKKIGFSLNEVHELEVLLDNNIVPDIIQAPFNYLDKRFVDYFKKMKEKGCEIHSRSAFLQGLFFCNINELSSIFNPVKKTIESLQLKYSESLPAFLLGYCLKKDFIDKVIIGVNNFKQFEANINSVEDFKYYSYDENIEGVPENILIPSKWI